MDIKCPACGRGTVHSIDHPTKGKICANYGAGCNFYVSTAEWKRLNQAPPPPSLYASQAIGRNDIPVGWNHPSVKPPRTGWYLTIRDTCRMTFREYCLAQYQASASRYDTNIDEWYEGYNKVVVVAWCDVPAIPEWVLGTFDTPPPTN
jgi:hypothetical protein